MNGPLTWVGWFESTASFPVVNRGLCDGLARQGYTVLRNQHNLDWGPDLTDTCLAFQYPPAPLNIRHARNICLSLWEFWGGAAAVPDTFKAVFADFDLIVAPNEFVAANYRAATDTPVQVVPFLGVDVDHFTPDGPRADWAALFPGEAWVQDAQRIVLMVGGSDTRHGWDVAERVVAQMPDSVHLVAKLSKHYPRKLDEPDHPRIHKLYADLTDLAPLYRASDAYLMSARGVGFALPVIEALACGLPVASTDLPPIYDYATDAVVFAGGGEIVPLGVHHVHHDCRPYWLEPDADALADALLKALTRGKVAPDADWRARWSWDARAQTLAQEVAL